MPDDERRIAMRLGLLFWRPNDPRPTDPRTMTLCHPKQPRPNPCYVIGQREAAAFLDAAADNPELRLPQFLPPGEPAPMVGRIVRALPAAEIDVDEVCSAVFHYARAATSADEFRAERSAATWSRAIDLVTYAWALIRQEVARRASMLAHDANRERREAARLVGLGLGLIDPVIERVLPPQRFGDVNTPEAKLARSRVALRDWNRLELESDATPEAQRAEARTSLRWRMGLVSDAEFIAAFGGGGASNAHAAEIEQIMDLAEACGLASQLAELADAEAMRRAAKPVWTAEQLAGLGVTGMFEIMLPEPSGESSRGSILRRLVSQAEHEGADLAERRAAVRCARLYLAVFPELAEAWRPEVEMVAATILDERGAEQQQRSLPGGRTPVAAPEAPQQASSPPTGSRSQRRRRSSQEVNRRCLEAAQLVSQFPELSNAEIAWRVQLHPSQLSKSEVFQRARRASRWER